MSERGSRGSKRPSDQVRIARLQQKFTKTDDGGKSRAGTSAPVPASKAPSDPLEARASCPRKDQPVTIVPTSWSRREDPRSHDPSASASGAEQIKRRSSAQKVLVTKFDDHLTSEVAESSRHSDPVQASNDLVKKLVEVSYSSRAYRPCLSKIYCTLTSILL